MRIDNTYRSLIKYPTSKAIIMPKTNYICITAMRTLSQSWPNRLRQVSRNMRGPRVALRTTTSKVSFLGRTTAGQHI